MTKTDRLRLSVALCALVSASPAQADEPLSGDLGSVGIISSVTGEARITRSADSQHATQPTFRGPIIYGDHISTTKNATVGLLVGQQSLLTLQELSDVRIAEAASHRQVLDMVRGRVCLAVGQLASSATEPLRLRTPTAIVTAAPGTVLNVDVTAAPTASRLPDGASGARAIRISSTHVAQRAAAPVVETYQVIEGSIDIVSLASSSSRTTVRSGQNVRIAGGVIGQPYNGPQVNCRVQNTQILPPHTVTPTAAQHMLVQQQMQTAAATPSAAAMSHPSGGHGSSPTIPIDVILPTTGIATSTTHTTISVRLP